MLLTGTLPGGGMRLHEYLTLLDQGVDAKRAFRQVIAQFAEIEDRLKRYLDRRDFDAFVFNNRSDIAADRVSIRPLNPAETSAELGTADVWLHENTAARQRLEKAIQLDPHNALALESLGILSFDEGQDRQALTLFERALQQDANLYLASYYRAMLSSAPASALSELLDRNRDFAPAYIQLAKHYFRGGQFERALAPALKAAQLRPSLGGYHILVGKILHALGRDSEAAAVARFVAERWPDLHRDEAVDLWLQLSQQARQGVALSKRPPVPGTQMISGTVTSLACRDKDRTMAFVIDTTLLTLRVKDETIGLGLSDTVWYGPDHFDRCRHLQGLRVIAQYKNRELIQLDILDP
jgi:tetratricopeptide (TPR) repeat protein